MLVFYVDMVNLDNGSINVSTWTPNTHLNHVKFRLLE